MAKQIPLEVVVATSNDPAHPASAAVDGNKHTFFVSTGGFPQDLILRLSTKASIAKIRISIANAKHITFDRCDGTTPGHWQPYVEANLPEQEGWVEHNVSTPGFPITFLRIRVNSGYADFIAIQDVVMISA